MLTLDQIGKKASGHDRRIVVVHDGADFVEKVLSEQRIKAWTDALMPHEAKILDPALMPPNAVTMDSGEAMAHLIGQTTYTEAKMRERLYLAMQARQLMTFSGEAGEWADVVRYELEDGVGEADWGSEAGDDIPYVDVKYDQVVRTIAHGRIGYFYTFQELRQSAYLKRPLNERRLVKAQQAAERALNKAALYGIPSKNLPGFFTQTVCPQVACGNGAGSVLNGAWDDSDTTAAEILFDLNWGLNYVYTAMGFNYVPTDIGVPHQAWNRIVSSPRSDHSDMTIWKFILENNISKATMAVDIKIRPIIGLDTAGAATTGGAVTGTNSRAIFWINNEDMAVCHLPMPLRFQAPQIRDLRINVPGEQRFGGYMCRYPKSMFYMDKVLAAG